MPDDLSHCSPPLQPPSRHELGPGLTLKSQPRRPFQKLGVTESEADTSTIENYDSTQIRPAIQLSGTWNVTELEGGASQLLQIHQRARLATRKLVVSVSVPSNIVRYRSASVGVSEKLRYVRHITSHHTRAGTHRRPGGLKL